MIDAPGGPLPPGVNPRQLSIYPSASPVPQSQIASQAENSGWDTEQSISPQIYINGPAALQTISPERFLASLPPSLQDVLRERRLSPTPSISDAPPDTSEDEDQPEPVPTLDEAVSYLKRSFAETDARLGQAPQGQAPQEQSKATNDRVDHTIPIPQPAPIKITSGSPLPGIPTPQTTPLSTPMKPIQQPITSEHPIPQLPLEKPTKEETPIFQHLITPKKTRLVTLKLSKPFKPSKVVKLRLKGWKLSKRGKPVKLEPNRPAKPVAPSKLNLPLKTSKPDKVNKPAPKPKPKTRKKKSRRKGRWTGTYNESDLDMKDDAAKDDGDSDYKVSGSEYED